ncbi:MBL fold metallo-hydrolase [Cellulomonas composti]|uniref:Hydrolase n=1 Tax=Cellulomonas composti TaxID=266130 RepID=A0A511J6N5_9CELL|nr:MBL fold metallo-hydrolase [Cellulomonas composti]GEL93655.1 hydrolase [Cellulomonas composti]
MDVLTVISPVFGARCSVLVAADGSCVVVDPGALVAPHVVALVRERALRPVAVLLTHGHVDHCWDAAEVGGALGVPVRVHAADAYRLADPFGTLGALGGRPHDPDGPLAQALRAAGADPTTYRVPTDVETFGSVGGGRDDELAPVPGWDLVARHAPGHTQGSTLYLVGPLVLTGDVLFAGTIGRTDLPGGDGDEMARTLREVVATLDPALVVVPGHGPTSDVATELATNPYLVGR